MSESPAVRPRRDNTGPQAGTPFPRSSWDMRPFALTQDLITGVPAIDEQHGELLDLANEVVDASRGDLHPELLDLAMTFLVGYTSYHFAAEERVMTDLNYPQHWEHCDSHRRLQREVASRVAEVRVNRACQEGKAETALFLGTLLVQHIRDADRELAAFLRTQTIDLRTLSLPDLQSLKDDGCLPDDFDARIAMGAVGMRKV